VNRTPKRRLIVLAGASALAIVGLVWLAVRASGDLPEWAWAAAASPLAMRCMAIMAAGMAALGLAMAFLVRIRSRTRPAGFRGFYVDQGGTAAIEMAFVFPLGLMIFLLVIQAALEFTANMVVHYAAFAAARMAIVVVPLNLDNDPIFKEKRNWVRNPDVASVAKSEKLEMIRRAAVMAVMPVSAKATSGTVPADTWAGAAVQTESSKVFKHFGVNQRPWFYLLNAKPPYEPWFSRAKKQYDYANSEITLKSPPADGEASSGGSGQVLVTRIKMDKPRHWEQNRNDWCPFHHRRLDYSNPRFPPVYFCPTVLDNGTPDARKDYGFDHWDDNGGHWREEELHVYLTYCFLLEIPYANRFMGEEVAVPGRQGKQYATQIHADQKLMNEGEPELKPKDYEWPPGT
jgi:Flp pilus assembly protein TadG